MKYCKKCVQPDTRPGLVFDKEGVCAACRYWEETARIDWAERDKRLREIADWARGRARQGFDCIIGVSGGKDSHVQAFYTRDRLGLRALLVNCAPDGITDVGRSNLENLVQHGFDMISYRPNPRVIRALARRSFIEHGNPVKPSEYSLFAVSYQAALRFGIPLVIQGENPAATLGVVESIPPGDDALMIRQHNTLGGGNAGDWVQDGIGLKDLQFYQFPDAAELGRAGIRAIWIGHYVKEWSYSANIQFAVDHGLRGRPGHEPSLTGRLSPHCSIDSDMQIVNQMLKFYKFGFGFVTDEVCYFIREGRMSRQEAAELVERYDGKCDERYIREFCEYIGMDEAEFWTITDRWVNKSIFERDGATVRWKPRFRVGRDFPT
ncbi:MAG TPA: N-acetyl sugar amidotransferase [bacterium]|nr:N-acetyl sugar amidotransferase [bacterium]